LVEGKQAPFASADFAGRNHWYEVLVDRRISVYVGGEGYMGDSSRGVLRILVSSIDGLSPLAPGERYDTPALKGPIQITDAVGERLTLEAADGTRFYFDVATRQWVNP
jgi:hypothetical protein